MNLNSSTTPATLIIMTAQEKMEFLPEPLNQQLVALLPNAVHIEAPVSDPEWKELLAQHRPKS
ncbi:hypothetical protein P4C99_11660 [Pontiellaceae bacterium B1224]|nr:hypothetical protein [Pontiellaceae bacterium B1224]